MDGSSLSVLCPLRTLSSHDSLFTHLLHSSLTPGGWDPTLFVLFGMGGLCFFYSSTATSSPLRKQNKSVALIFHIKRVSFSAHCPFYLSLFSVSISAKWHFDHILQGLDISLNKISSDFSAVFPIFPECFVYLLPFDIKFEASLKYLQMRLLRKTLCLSWTLLDTSKLFSWETSCQEQKTSVLVTVISPTGFSFFLFFSFNRQ